MAKNSSKDSKKTKYVINEKIGTTEVHVSDEAIVVIAALATTEVEGVHSMAGNITNEIASKLGVGKLSKGVKVSVDGNEASVAVSINVKDGYELPTVTKQIQENVKEAVGTMTGLEVVSVNVSVTGVSLEKD